jgi:glycosyltransferase involved in cell wall biosynthesis
VIEQLRLQRDHHDLTIFFPELPSRKEELCAFLTKRLGAPGESFSYPIGLYKISRSGALNLWPLISALVTVPVWILLLRRQFQRFDGFYVNGNKAALIPLLLRVFGDRRPIFWHFRDFPSSRFFSLIQRFFWSTQEGRRDFTLIANSNAVKSSLTPFFESDRIKTIYNLPGELPRRQVSKIHRIGVVAMIAPWKGLHEVLHTLALYRAELKHLGIEEVVFYGSSLYLTDGEHRCYEDELRRWITEFRLDFVKIESGMNPREIFQSIDLLIHSSISPEPFGRVLVEAMKSGVPVISTALGGAGELVIPD